jgi:hypothetical protein
MEFSDADIPKDTVPDLSDVEYPCRICGKEAGPYGGRGPKPKLCPEHKKVTAGGKSSKVTGAPATLAAQATGVLVQLNGMLAMGAMAMGMFGTASAISDANGTFEEQAYQALLTDPELCRLLLKGGVKSAKVSLGLAYVGMGVSVVPTAMMELKEKKAERDARKAQEEADAARA